MYWFVKQNNITIRPIKGCDKKNHKLHDQPYVCIARPSTCNHTQERPMTNKAVIVCLCVRESGEITESQCENSNVVVMTAVRPWPVNIWLWITPSRGHMWLICQVQSSLGKCLSQKMQVGNTLVSLFGSYDFRHEVETKTICNILEIVLLIMHEAYAGKMKLFFSPYSSRID